MLKTIAFITLIVVTIVQTIIPITAMLLGYLIFYFLFKKKQKTTEYTQSFHDRLERASILQRKNRYLHSSEWKAKRLQVFQANGYACQICHSEQQLECHHITYERLEKEKLSDLACLCRVCHQNIHDRLGYDLNTTYPIGV